MCLLAALDSQGIVVKCTAAIFLRTVDFSGPCSEIRLARLTNHNARTNWEI